MLKRLVIVVVLGCLCFTCITASAEETEPKIAVVEWIGQQGEHATYVVPFINRLNGLGISTNCLSSTELFIEKKVYEYDAVVVIPIYLTINEFYELKTYVEKGGIFIPIVAGANAVDIDENGQLNFPPDIWAISKGGILYELVGGKRSGGSYSLTKFEILKSCPITEGLKVGEIIEANVSGMNIIPDKDVDVCCGNGVVVNRKGSEAIRTEKGSVIQVKKTGKGANIWITAYIHDSQEQWADILLKNIFSKETFSWVLRSEEVF